MAEGTSSSHKPVFFNEDTDASNDIVCQKSPIARSPRNPKAMTHFPSSSNGQGSSKFRHKSPASRHLAPHHSVSKNKILHDWDEVNNSIRKTQSTALPALINTSWSRSTTVSTPDLKVENQNVGTEDRTREGNFNFRTNQRTKLYYNVQLICVILNCIILAAGIIHIGAALILTIYKEIVLFIVEYPSYVTYVITIYINAIILIILSLSGLWSFHHRPKKNRYVVCSLLVAVLTISIGMLQSSIHANIQNNVRERMLTSVRKQEEMSLTNKRILDYIQKTYKCCGVDGNLDWCVKTDKPKDIIDSKEYLGSYVCHLPISCCIENIDEIMASKEFILYSQKNNLPCSVYSTPWNTSTIGCLGHVKREVQYVGKLLRLISFGTGLVLLGSSVTSAILVYFLEK